MLALGGAVVALAALLGGFSGFGYGAVATPLLLAVGFRLEFVVTANLAVALVTRTGTAVRLRDHVAPRRALLLAGSAVPGMALGAFAIARADTTQLARAAGALAAAAALLLLVRGDRPPRRRLPGAPAAAGFAGGVLGTTTSLNGLPAALLLGRERVPARTFVADLAVYFVVSNALSLAALALAGRIDADALFPAVVLWLPGALAANFVGVALGPRLPREAFRRFTLALVVAAGVAAATTA